MRIRVLSLAVEDLDRGRAFYERQQRGLGEYFLDSLFSDIDALLLHAGVHPACRPPLTPPETAAVVR